MTRRGLAVRFAIAALVLGGLILLFGPRATAETLREFQAREAAVVFLLTTAWLGLRAEAMFQTVRVSLSDVSRRDCAAAFLAGVFVASIFPVGNVGGIVSSGYVLKERIGVPGTTAVGILSAWEVLNMIASMSVAVVGIVVVLLPGGRVDPTVLTTMGIIVTIIGTTIGLWRFRRDWLVTISIFAATLLHALVIRLAPSTAERFAPQVLAARGRRFVAGFTALTNRPKILGRTVMVLVLAWSLLGVSLLVSFRAFGVELPLGVALLVPQIAGLAGLIPLPGGLGSIDATLVALLISLTAEHLDTIGAAVLVFRAATYWWGLLLSSIVVVGLGIKVGNIRSFNRQ